MQRGRAWHRARDSNCGKPLQADRPAWLAYGNPTKRPLEVQGNGNFVGASNRWSAPMPQPNDLSRSLVALDQNSTIIAVVEVIQSSWLVGGVVPGY